MTSDTPSAASTSEFNVRTWLGSLNLDGYAKAFEMHHIDAEVLPWLDSSDLKDIGVISVGHRKRLLRAVQLLSLDAQAVGHVTPTDRQTVTSASLTVGNARAEQASSEGAITDEATRAERTQSLSVEFRPMKLFLSYGRDSFVTEVQALKAALESRGHEVWFDDEQLGVGLDWEQRIEAGLAWCDRVVLTMTPHSVRRPDGYCLNELAKALERQKVIIPVLLADVPNGAPTSICRIQYLDWRDAVPAVDKPERFATRMTRLCEAIEHDKLDFEGGQQRLLRALQPLNYSGDIDRHITRFTGRSAMFARLRRWLDDPCGAQIIWLCGGSGLGKSALAAMLAHRWGEAGAVHFCVAGHADKADPRRAILSIAFQLSTKIDLYRTRLMALDLEKVVDKDARALFDVILVAPFTGDFPAPPHPWMVVVDALDEANAADGQNDLAELLGQEWRKLPAWLRLVATGQPEGEVRTWLADAELLSLSADDPEHLNDLGSFLRNALDRLGRPVADDAVRRIIDKSEGAFQYMVLLLEEIRQGRCDPQDDVTLPRGMQAAYLQAFKRRFPSTDSYRSQYQPLLEMMLASPDPVPVGVMASACALSPLEVRRRLAHMGSMVAIQRPDDSLDSAWDTVRLTQSSLRNWLTAVDERTRQPVAGVYTADPIEGLKVLAQDLLQRWNASFAQAGEPDSYVARTLLDVLMSAGLKSQADEVALDLARHWSKRSVSRAWPASEHAVQWAQRAMRTTNPDRQAAHRVAEAYLLHGKLAADRGDSPGALADVQISRQILGQLLDQGAPDTVLLTTLSKCRQQAATIIREQGNLASALAEQRAAVEILERLDSLSGSSPESASQLASGLNILGNMFRVSGDNDAALETYQRSLALREGLVRRNPANRAYRRDLGGSHNNIGIVLKQKGDLEGSLREYQCFRDIVQSLCEEDPQFQEWRRTLGISHFNMSLALEALGRIDEALSEGHSALRIHKQLADEEPERVDYLARVSNSHGRLAELLKDRGDLQGALQQAQADLEIKQALAASDSSNLSRQQGVAVARGTLASILQTQGRTEHAIRELTIALEIHERVVTLNPKNAVWWGALASLASSMATALRASGQIADAIEQSSRALEIRDNLARQSEDNATHKSSLATALRAHAQMLQAANGLVEAAERAHASVAICESLVAQDPRNAAWQESMAQSLGCLGSILAEQGHLSEAERPLQRARDIMLALVAGNPERPEWLDLLSDMHRELGWLLERQGRLAEALIQHRADLLISRALGAGQACHLGWQSDMALAHLNVGWTLLRLGTHAEAVVELEAAVRFFQPLAHPQRPGSLLDLAGASALLQQALESAALQPPADLPLGHIRALRWPPHAVDSALRRRMVEPAHALQEPG
jgi:tetratricopeptide (TPR) repeat protein